MTNPRYIVQHTGAGYAQLWDTQEDITVFTNSGQVYEAPIENVQWTADRMNARETTPEPVRDMDGGDVDPTATADVTDPSAKSQSRLALAQERRARREANEAHAQGFYTEQDMELMRQDGALRTERAQARTLYYARELGRLEAQVMGLRDQVIGIHAGLSTLPTAYPDLIAALAIESVAALRARLDAIVDEAGREFRKS